jgi:hypothetical protein
MEATHVKNKIKLFVSKGRIDKALYNEIDFNVCLVRFFLCVVNGF